ncbi:MAG: cobalamin-dependent protein [Anaerolineales bacterium]|jgi:methanogenic corrinoid protein MtbC1
MNPNDAQQNTNQETDLALLSYVEQKQIGRLTRYVKGSMLYWQGDPVADILVVRSGAIKIFSISRNGKAHTYAIAGIGAMLGASEYLLSKNHEYLTEAIEDTEIIAIPLDTFDQLLASDPAFSAIVMKKLARGMSFLAEKVRDLSFLDVQQRLKHSLIDLADRHGIEVENGVKIDLSITHEQIGEMVAANRTTITAFLNELRKRGYLWKDGRHLVIIPPKHIEILDNLGLSIIEGLEDQTKQLIEDALAVGIDPGKALEAMSSGMRQVERMLDHDEIDVSDEILSAYAMRAGFAMIEHQFAKTGKRLVTLGKVVIGTVHGDIHDIGRTMVAALLTATGFDVIDLGNNVSTDHFLTAVKDHQPDILAMSSLMTTSASEQRKVIQALQSTGMIHQLKVMVGGGAITRKFSESIGAHGYAPSARRAVELAWRLSGRGKSNDSSIPLDVT